MQYSNKREPEEDLEQRRLSVFETTISFGNVLQGKEMSSPVVPAGRQWWSKRASRGV